LSYGLSRRIEAEEFETPPPPRSVRGTPERNVDLRICRLSICDEVYCDCIIFPL
jgi:hypothetical protein